jgi:hypothetical protein
VERAWQPAGGFGLQFTIARSVENHLLHAGAAERLVGVPQIAELFVREAELSR